MCGGGGGSAPVDTYKGPPGPGSGIAGVPVGFGDYQGAANALLSTGQTYGQLAANVARTLQQAPAFTAPPAPQSAFDSGIGQYIASGGATPPMGQSPAMSAIGQVEADYDPRTAATEMLQSYEPGYEARPLSYYTPNAMSQLSDAGAAGAAGDTSTIEGLLASGRVVEVGPNRYRDPMTGEMYRPGGGFQAGLGYNAGPLVSERELMASRGN